MSDTPTSGEKFNHWAAGRLSALYDRNNMVEWVMAFNLLRALLILKLQVATGEIAWRGCSRGHFGGPRGQVKADDRYRRTPQDLQYRGAPTDRSSYKHSKHTTECSHIVFTPRSEK